MITSNGKTKDYVQTDRQVRAKATIASAKSPDKPDQMAKNWHDSLWRAFASDILGRGEDPPGGKPATVLRVEYFDGKQSVGFDEFARVEPTSESSSAVSEEPAGARRVRPHRALGRLDEGLQRQPADHGRPEAGRRTLVCSSPLPAAPLTRGPVQGRIGR